MEGQAASLTKDMNSLLSSLTAQIKDLDLKDLDLITVTIKLYEKFIFEHGDHDAAAHAAKEELESFRKTKIDIAVTGETGSGKSSFINAIRGLGAEDAGGAQTGVTETTKTPTPYPHPNFPNVTLWDLPGINSPVFKPEKYLEQVNFSRYSFFIIVGSERFRSSHADLANEIQKMDKKFYFVRSKVDSDLANEKRDHPRTYREESVLEKIRENSKRNLREQGFSNPQVFLLSNWEFDKYDLSHMVETLERDLPSLQRLTFLLSLPNFSPEIIAKKKTALKGHIWKISLVSAACNAIPIPGVPLACDIGILVASIITFYKMFGLDDASLAIMARQAGKPIAELKAIKGPQAGKDKSADIVKALVSASDIIAKCFKCAPIVSLVVGVSAVMSFAATYYVLSNILDELAEAAQRVRAKCLE